MFLQGRTALHEAVFKGSAMLKFLLRKGCKPDIKDEQVTHLVVILDAIFPNIKKILLIRFK